MSSHSRSSARRPVLRAAILVLVAVFAATAPHHTHWWSGAQAAPRPATILLVGASGMIGSRILTEAAGRGHAVLAASRHPEKIAAAPNVTAVKLDATDREGFTKLARQADVIVMATSPRGGGDPMTEARAVGDAAIAVAHATGRRLIVVGGAGSLNLPNGTPLVDTLPAAYQKEARAMRAVLDSLKASDIDWTFFSPASQIAPGTRTGHYRVGTAVLLSDDKGVSRISAEDYAAALVAEIEKPEHERSQMTAAY
jgi:uncharacterized protein